jgi:beta-phosphoglucomutase-like phosphatase (HAD superfamily)
MSRCEALIFDVDGTLADTEDLHRRAFNQAFEECQLDWVWDVPLYGELLQVTGGKERIGSFIVRLRLPPTERRALQARVPEIHRAKTRLYAELIASGQLELRSGIRRLMTEAREAGMLLAIASTTTAANIEPLVVSGLGNEAMSWFAVVATGDVVKHKKPAPDIYNVALKTLEVSPARAIAFEDSAPGLQSAQAAGLFTVVTPSFWTQDQEFAAADLLLGSLGDLSLQQLTAKACGGEDSS